MPHRENLVRRLSVALFAQDYRLAGMGQGQVTLKKGSQVVLLLSYEDFNRWPVLKLGKIGRAEVVLMGGGAEALAQLKACKPRFTRAQVNLHHLSDDDELWASGGKDGPVAQALTSRHDLPDISNEAFGDLLKPQLEVLKSEVVEQFSFQRALAGRKTVATYGLLSIIAVFFALEMLWGGAESTPTLVRMGALVGDRALGPEWWRMLSCAFLHAGVIHVAMNGYVLFILGRGTERILGTERFLVVYVLSAVGGSLASALLQKGGFSVGASGAIWGLLAAQGMLAFRPRGLLPEAVLPGLKKAAMINLGLNVMISFQPRIDWAAHAGGGIVGGLLVATGLVTFGLPRLAEIANDQPVVDRKPFWLAPGAAILTLTLISGAIYAQIQGQPWTLKDDPVFAQRAIGDSSVGIEVPKHLEARLGANSSTEAVNVVFGDLLGDAALFDTVVFLATATIAPELMQAEFLAMQESLPLGIPSSATEVGQTVVVADEFLVAKTYALANGMHLERALILRPSFGCRVDVVVWPEFHSGVWVGAARRSVQTCGLSAP